MTFINTNKIPVTIWKGKPLSVLVELLMAFCLCLYPDYGVTGELYSLSVVNIPSHNTKDKIIDFTVEILNGKVRAVNSCYGCSAFAHNNPTIVVGFTNNPYSDFDHDYFDKFIVIEKGPKKIITLTMSVTIQSRRTETLRTVSIDKNQFILTPYKQMETETNANRQQCTAQLKHISYYP